MNEFNFFKSSFSNDIIDFINYRRSQGYKMNRLSYLRKIDTYMTQNDIKNRFIMEDIDRLRDAVRIYSKSYQYEIMLQLNQLLEYLQVVGYEIEFPNLSKRPSKNRTFVPYIYSDDEIFRYFQAVDIVSNNISRKSLLRIQLPILFRLLYCTGMRIGEALAIKLNQIDFKQNIIVLEFTKNRADRYIAINDSVAILLKKYINKVNHSINQDDPIFLSRHLHPLDISGLHL